MKSRRIPGKKQSSSYRFLLNAARSVTRAAYCPYSNFKVGAALLTESGAMFTGVNVENASYGLTMCAERGAVFAAVAAGHRTFCALAIVGGDDASPAWPCGACRQVLAEFCDPDMPIYVTGLPRGSRIYTCLLKELLPHTFRLGASRRQG